MHHCPNCDIKTFFVETSSHHVTTDAILIGNPSLTSALSSLKFNQKNEAWSHVSVLAVQGAAASIVKKVISKQHVTLWAACVKQVPAPIHNFFYKALQSQLPAASNLVCWSAQKFRIVHCTEMLGGKRTSTSFPTATHQQPSTVT